MYRKLLTLCLCLGLSAISVGASPNNRVPSYNLNGTHNNAMVANNDTANNGINNYTNNEKVVTLEVNNNALVNARVNNNLLNIGRENGNSADNSVSWISNNANGNSKNNNSADNSVSWISNDANGNSKNNNTLNSVNSVLNPGDNNRNA